MNLLLILVVCTPRLAAKVGSPSNRETCWSARRTRVQSLGLEVQNLFLDVAQSTIKSEDLRAVFQELSVSLLQITNTNFKFLMGIFCWRARTRETLRPLN